MRQRATALVFRDGKLLLVRDRGKEDFSLPGGEMHRDEPTVSAAAREVCEELGLHIIEVKRLHDCDFSGSSNEHKVCVLEVTGEPRIRDHELAEFRWWDMRSPLPRFPHVNGILSKYARLSSIVPAVLPATAPHSVPSDGFLANGHLMH